MILNRRNKNPLDRDFYKNILHIATPIALAQLLTSLLAVVDAFMVSSLGVIAVAAVGVAASYTFLMIIVLFGFFSGLGIFIAQYWGSKEIENVQKVFAISLVIAVSIGLLFFGFAFFFTDTLIGIFNNGADVEDALMLEQFARNYLKIASWSYMLLAINFSINMVMRSIEKVWYPQIVMAGIVLINTVLNYLLIEGNYGFTALGIEGAAIATLISSFVGTIFLLGYVIVSHHEVFMIKLSILKHISLGFIKKVFIKAGPVAINETLWGLGMTFYLIAFGFISTDAIASIQISNLIMGLFWVVNAGIGSASAIMIGKKLGENNLDVAKHWGDKVTKLVVYVGIFLGIVLFFTSDFIASSFTEITPEVKSNVSQILKIFAIYLPIKFTNAQQITGTLRSGGDTRYSMYTEVFALWLIGVPLAFILCLYTALPLYMIILIINVEEVIKVIVLIRRFKTYKWVKNLTV
ncbi:MAG: MATE family efflux transporter [Candidatus Izemoplasma sp.]